MEDKRTIRQAIRELRASVLGSPEAIAAKSLAIISSLKILPEWKVARTILAYYPLPGEVDTVSLLSSTDKRIVLPLVEGDHLLLKEYVAGNLVEGFKGIMEPRADAKDVDPTEIDFAIIPGVAFDSSCRRLGRGKGYYDRTLPLLGCPKAGVAFDWQMVEEVPCDPWDVPLDLVVTNCNIFRTKR